MSDDLIGRLECLLVEGVPDAACQEAVALLRSQAARLAEVEAQRDHLAVLPGEGALTCSVCAHVAQETGKPCKLCGRLTSPEREARDKKTASEGQAVTNEIDCKSTRLCLSCGKSFDAVQFKVGDTPCTPTEDGYVACTLDMTVEEAFLHWRKIAHDYREVLTKIQMASTLSAAQGWARDALPPPPVSPTGENR